MQDRIAEPFFFTQENDIFPKISRSIQYLTNQKNRFTHFVSNQFQHLSNYTTSSFLFNKRDLQQIKKNIAPVILTTTAYIAGEYVTSMLSNVIFHSEDNKNLIKLFIGLSLLGVSTVNRITDKKASDSKHQKIMVASELLAIGYVYSSTYSCSRELLSSSLSENYSLITSLSLSAIVIPSGIAFIVEKAQEQLVKRELHRGAQRSDTALISSGLTSVANTYFLMNHFLLTEIMTLSRMFQLALISHNIQSAEHVAKQFRNFPALIADIGPPIVKKYLLQKDKIEFDYEYNNTLQKVIKFDKYGACFFDIARRNLKNNDLVVLDDTLDHDSIGISGEIIALQRNQNHQFTLHPEIKKLNVNLKAHNGEDVWIELNTNNTLYSQFLEINLHAIREGKQVGVLRGTKINTFGSDNFFIKIKEEAEHSFDANYEKKAIINEIITHYKRRNVLLATALSIVLGGALSNNFQTFSANSLLLLFNLFQMLIPFSETFLREIVNNSLINKLNKNTPELPLNTIDALRIVDLCNAKKGYYHDRFPSGVAIISDKTGTLTTSKMDILGCWTQDMPSDPQALMADRNNNGFLTPSPQQQIDCFEIFASAYTCKSKELEPEEHSIFNMFKTLFADENCLKVTALGHNHFQKIVSVNNTTKHCETFHLGLFPKLGGRFTIVSENNNKFLVYCGVPRQDTCAGTPFIQHYSNMKKRSGVLTRDWCIARAIISDNQFDDLKKFFFTDKKTDIEKLIKQKLLHELQFACTFLIDNPVKKQAEKFITDLHSVNIPVFLATGDTAEAAFNIAKVLCPTTKDILVIRDPSEFKLDATLSANTTIVFAGINPIILKLLDELLTLPHESRPVIVFSEMSTKGKGLLAKHLKAKKFFVVANGDGTNDLAMMRHANAVIAHMTETGHFAPGVEQYSDISDFQLQNLLHSKQSFYELFDIHHENSQFLQLFLPLMHSQDKPSIALLLKSCKIGFELMRSLGYPVQDMWQQHWSTVLFDLTWLGIARYEILATENYAVDLKNLTVSNLSSKCLLATSATAIFSALLNYNAFSQATNVETMIGMLSLLPFILQKIFTQHPEQSFLKLNNERNRLFAKIQPKQLEQNTQEKERKYSF